MTDLTSADRYQAIKDDARLDTITRQVTVTAPAHISVRISRAIAAEILGVPDSLVRMIASSLAGGTLTVTFAEIYP